jgi:hypothetical protein
VEATGCRRVTVQVVEYPRQSPSRCEDQYGTRLEERTRMMSDVAAPRDVTGGQQHQMKYGAPCSRPYCPVPMPKSRHLWRPSPTSTSAPVPPHPDGDKPFALRHVLERLRADRV